MSVIYKKGSYAKATTKVDIGGVQSEETQNIPVALPPPQATVGFKAGVTKNMGDFNSIRIDVSLYFPCTPEAEDIERTYLYVKDWVEHRLNKVLEEVENQ